MNLGRVAQRHRILFASAALAVLAATIGVAAVAGGAPEHDSIRPPVVVSTPSPSESPHPSQAEQAAQLTAEQAVVRQEQIARERAEKDVAAVAAEAQRVADETAARFTE